MKTRLVLLIGSILALLYAFMPQAAYASPGHPYIGGYFDCATLRTYKVIASHRFWVDETAIPTGGHWIAGLTSVAGGSTYGVSGWVYQNGVSLYRSNDVKWAPQSWYCGTKYHWQTPSLVGDGDCIAFYTRTEVYGSSILYSLYTYETWYDWYADTPEVDRWNHLTSDSRLWAGCTTIGEYKHFQFGVESSTAITGDDWWIMNENTGYHYSGTTWRYKPAKVCWHESSQITYGCGYGWLIGLENYDDVDVYHSQDYEVIWEYTGSTTVDDDETLWTGSGTISDSRSEPYEVI